MTAGGDRLDYPGDASSPTVSMLDAKMHINSTIPMRNAALRWTRHQNYYLSAYGYFNTFASPSVFHKKYGTILDTATSSCRRWLRLCRNQIAENM
jgi:hypothetical protein